MGDTFTSPGPPGLWDISTDLGLHGNEIAAIRKSVMGISQPLDAFWNPPVDSLPGGGSLAQTGQGILPPNLSHFPVDSAFIERAARLSCFTATTQALSPCSNGRSPGTKQKKGICLPDVEVGEFEFNGSSHENAAEGSSSINLGAKKRKKPDEDLAISSETKKAAIKSTNGKQSKYVKETSKNKEYIHVRARHGQATNSHSLAERVRREKISQRMKFLQEIVPGCSKVTGKAVMLEEIINYVQSLQQQVEFLSMKLAAVNPSLDFNMEALLSRDLLQCHGGTSSAIGLSPDLVNPQLHLSQQGLLQSGISGNYEPPNGFRRPINSPHNLFKSPTSQISDVWDADVQNVMKMATFSNQEFIDRAQDEFHL